MIKPADLKPDTVCRIYTRTGRALTIKLRSVDVREDSPYVIVTAVRVRPDDHSVVFTGTKVYVERPENFFAV